MNGAVSSLLHTHARQRRTRGECTGNGKRRNDGKESVRARWNVTAEANNGSAERAGSGVLPTGGRWLRERARRTERTSGRGRKRAITEEARGSPRRA